MKRRLETANSKGRAEWLVKWLNEENGPFWMKERNGDKMRIRTLIARLQALLKAVKDAPEQIPEREEAILASMRHYTMRPGFAAVESTGEIETFEDWTDVDIEESQALEALQALVLDRMFDRLTICAECREKLVVRWRKDQQYCSRKCRQKRYEGSTPRRKRKKQYMRDYYRDHLSSGRKRLWP